MYVYYKFGLFLIFILSVSMHFTRAGPPVVNQNSSYDDNYSDDYDDYYDNAETEDDATTAVSVINTDLRQTQATSISSAITTTKMPKSVFSFSSYFYPRNNHVRISNCPKVCVCLEDDKHILCNSAGLAHVPRDLPKSALIIDLSENNIAELGNDDFVNVSKVREINLSGNRLKTINKEAFLGLNHLQRLRLTDNKLTLIEPDTFMGATDLSELDLSNNSILLRSDGPFLTQPGLLKLSCRNCSLTQLYDDTFSALGSLNSLKLDLNDFNRKINAKAFIPLRNIIKLRLPELDPASVAELCNLLKTIDNISFKHFDVSCFELVLGTSFNESLILVTDPPYIPPEIAIVPTSSAASTEIAPRREATVNTGSGAKSKSAKSTTTTQPFIAAKKESMQESYPMMDGENYFNTTLNKSLTSVEALSNGKNMATNLTATVLSKMNGVTTTAVDAIAKAADKNETSQQGHISKETVNLLLICIIIIALFGIIIGLIFRKDVGGIKTKCCRTRKAEPKDQVHPAEEIPLNKLA